jgi:lycopene cyclase domain-containing protein
MAGSIFFPLVLSFDKKVNYVSSWKYLAAVFLWVSPLYIWWDVYFTKWEVWEFNPQYISGGKLWGLPLEEISFFLIVPFACIFIFDCVKNYNLQKFLGRLGSIGMRMLMALGLIVSAIHWGGYYTSTAAIVLLLAWVALELKYSNATKEEIYLSLLISYIPFLLINGVLTGSSTAQPIVVYNDAQNLPWRLGSIPVDDAIYQAGMMLWMFMVYSGAKKNKKIFYFF